MNRKPGENLRRCARMNVELLDRFKHKKEAYRLLEQGQVAWEEYGEIEYPGIRLGKLNH